MQIVRHESQTVEYFIKIARLTPEEAALSDHEIIRQLFPIPVYWDGQVLARLPGRKTGATYIRVKLYKE